MNKQEIVDLNRRHNFFPWVVQGAFNPLPVDRGEGVRFSDVDGKSYLDFSSQLMNVGAGLGNKKIITAIQEQAARMSYIHPSYATEMKGLLSKKLAEITPGTLEKTLFTCSGAEGNENAIKFAKLYTGRTKFLARYRSFHGVTAGALSLTGDPYRLPVEPMIPGVVHIMDPYCYRCPFGWTKDTCHRECIDHVQQVIELEGADKIAALFLEGVTGSNGIIIPPDEYWPRMREICDKYGILLVDDEVMSGFGRTGEWFGIDHWGVAPDIMTLGKGISSGYVPLAGVIVSKKIAEYFDDKPLPMGLTNNAHPLGIAAGLAAVRVYEEEKLIENSKRMGEVLKAGLEELEKKHPSVGDVRCIGLFSTIELVKDKETKVPLSPQPGTPALPGDEIIAPKLMGRMKELGMHCFAKWNYIFPVPPLSINESELGEGLGTLDKILDMTDKMLQL